MSDNYSQLSIFDFLKSEKKPFKITKPVRMIELFGGNAIAENCLVAIFGQMFEGKEDVYKNISRNPDGSRKENYFDDGKADAN